MSGLISKNNFSSATLEAFQKIDKSQYGNQDGNISIGELKKFITDEKGNISKEKLNSLGITNQKDIDVISKEYKSHKSEPNKISFSQNKLDLTKFSEEQFKKYQSVKTLLKDSPKSLSQFQELLRKYNDSNSIDHVLNRTIEKFSKVKDAKNIEFSKSEWEGHGFGLDDAKKIVKIANSKIRFIPDKIVGKKNPLDKINSSVILLGNRTFSGVGAFKMEMMGNVKNIAEYAINSGIGNCAEHACISATIAKDFKGINNIEIFSMSIESGHAFVVINRDKDSTDDKMSTWGKNAIIIDSWTGIAFKAIDFPSDIKGKKHPDFPKGEVYMELKSYEF